MAAVPLPGALSAQPVGQHARSAAACLVLCSFPVHFGGTFLAVDPHPSSHWGRAGAAAARRGDGSVKKGIEAGGGEGGGVACGRFGEGGGEGGGGAVFEGD